MNRLEAMIHRCKGESPTIMACPSQSNFSVDALRLCQSRKMATLLQDFRSAMRVLGRSPGFTVTAVLVLALATGANTAIFSVIEAVLLRPLPYQNSQRLSMLWKTVPSRNIEWDWTFADGHG